MSTRLFATTVSPTTEIEAVNTMLSVIGESPINSFEEIPADVAIARNTLTEISRAVQLEGWHWNTEDNFPLIPDSRTHELKVGPSALRVHFPDPQDKELAIRGSRIYDRVNHTYKFPSDFRVDVTITYQLPFEELPEAARRYITIRAARVYQARVVGSGTLWDFSERDEAMARTTLMAEEHKLDRPNILKGTQPPTGTWNPMTAILNRGGNHYGR